jgi:hypothetical protein
MSARAILLPFALILGALSPSATDDAGRSPLPAPGVINRWPGGATTSSHPATLRGRVLLPDDGSPLGLRVYAATMSHLDSADVDATGAFILAFAGVDCDSVDVRLDVGDERLRRYHPARLRVAIPRETGAEQGETIRALLVPTTFTIASGTYRGTTVPIDVGAALAPEGEHTRYWRVLRSTRARGVPIGWPDDRFPLPLAVSGQSAPMRAVDSASVWAIARQLERDFGQTLFRPTSVDSARSEGASVTLTLNPEEDTPGITFITYDGHGDVYDATIAIRSSALLSDGRVVTHELVHALGFGHSVGWNSVMNSVSRAAGRASPSDVAYAQLFYRLRRVHLEQRATHGILASGAEALRRMPVSANRSGCRWGGSAS